jgi:hypothetical protein
MMYMNCDNVNNGTGKRGREEKVLFLMITRGK